MIPTVGQILFQAYEEPRMQGQEHEVVVLKVGRKWCEVAWADRDPALRVHKRFDMTDPRWPVEGSRGYSSESRVWISRGAWRREQERDAAWRRLQRVLAHRYRLGVDVQAEDIRQAARALGVLAEFERATP